MENHLNKSAQNRLRLIHINIFLNKTISKTILEKIILEIVPSKMVWKSSWKILTFHGSDYNGGWKPLLKSLKNYLKTREIPARCAGL